MTNEEYLQWEPMLIKIALRYRNNPFGLDVDDLKQVGYFGMAYAFEHFQEDRGASFKTFIFNCIEWTIKKELKKYERIEAFTTVSIDAVTGEDMTLEDILQDISVNIEEEVTDKIVLQEYMNEIDRCLNELEREILYLKVFDNKSYKQIEKALDLKEKRASSIFVSARRKLLYKSRYIREHYLYYVGANINEYSNPADIVVAKVI